MVNTTHIFELSAFMTLLPRISFDRGVIVEILQNITSSNPSFLDNPLIFYQDPQTGIIQNNLSGSPIIPLGICTAITGTGLFNMYNDAVAKILTWLVPTFLLLTGMHYAPSGWRKFAMVPHLLSDPIDSLWSLLSKIEVAHRCSIMAEQLTADGEAGAREQNIGLIISRIEELYSARKSSGIGHIQTPENIAMSSGELGLVANDVCKVDGNFAPEDGMVLKDTIDKKELDLTIIEVTEWEDARNLQLSVNTSKGVFTINQTPFCGCTHPSLDILYAKTSQRILDVRVSGVRQTIFSICAYVVLGIVAAFVPQFGSNPNPSGGKIVTFILLSWLLPTILLSNIVGQFNTSRSCLDAIMTFKEELERLMADQSGSRHMCGGARARRWIAMMDLWEFNTHSRSALEIGSLYSFRLSKQYPDLNSQRFATRCSSTTSDLKEQTLHGDWQLILLSFLPVTTSFIAAFIVLWSSPTYFSCRHIMIICIYLTWILSILFTNFIPRLSPFLSIKATFNIVLAKDVCLSGAIMGILVASACGLFNSCFCWSGWWYLRYWTSEPQVQLAPGVQFEMNVRWIYPVVVGLVMGAQGVWFGGMVWVGRSVYFGLMRRSEGWLWGSLLSRRVTRDEESLA